MQQKSQLVIKDDHPVMAWIPQHAGFLLSRFQVAANGKTAYERLKGKASRRALVDFAEKGVFMPVGAQGHMNKLHSKWESGRFVGIRPRSDEALIVTERGIEKRGQSGGCHRLTGGQRVIGRIGRDSHGLGGPRSRAYRECRRSRCQMLRRSRRKP